jgi:predicted amidohydrolase
MKIVVALFLFAIAIWVTWAQLGRNTEWVESKSPIEIVQSIKIDTTCAKNIVAIQPYMLTEDYTTEAHFYQKLKTYFERARQKEYFTKNTIVVLPEYIGTWLVVSGEKKSVLEAETINGAMTIMVLSNPLDFIYSLFDGLDEEDSFAAALFRMKSQQMATQFASACKQLAAEYQVTISAGSIVLPAPTVNGSNIEVNKKGPLYNVSFVFNPTGIEQKIIKKSYPITSELPFIKPYPIEELPSFDLPIGKTAVLICADSWYPESYKQINEVKPEVILVGSYCSTEGAMQSPWKGYDGGQQPVDVDGDDINKISEQEAWIKYALPGRIKSTGAKAGITIFLRGDLWDLGSDGYPLIVLDGSLVDVKKTERGGIYNICF